MIVGAAVGLPLNILAEQGRIDAEWPRQVATVGKGVGDLFLRLLSMIVVPLIVTSLVTGITGTGNLHGIGRLGLRTITYYISTSLIAIVTGLVLVNLIRPGVGADRAMLESIAQSDAEDQGNGVSAADVGLAHLRLSELLADRGEIDKAIKSLGRATDLGAIKSEWIQNDSSLEALRSESRFEEIVERVRQQEVAARDAARGSSVWATLWNQVFALVPPNPLGAMSDPSNRQVLAVIFFSLLFGIFICVVGGEAGALLSKLFAAAFEVMMKMTMFIMLTAPVGVLGFMLYASAGRGLGVFAALGWYVLTVAMGLAIHGFVTLPLVQVFLARRGPWSFFKATQPALVTAFSTASSNGTLPLTMTCVEKRAGISNRISSFVIPLGATINMDGTALYEAVAALFIAQVYGAGLTLGQQVIVAFTALLASIGAAGIPHAGTVMLIIVLNAVNLPIEAVGLILAVDRVLDMCRTTVNVWSDMTACAVVDRLERKGVSDIGEHQSC